MKKTIECPYCDGNAHLHIIPKEITFKKEVFEVQQHYYRCEKCEEMFTDTETDYITLVQAYNQYREKHSIPFPDEIARMREMYAVSAAGMSEILGLGANGYGNYEKGEIPTSAIGNLITSAENPWVFKELLVNAEEDLPKTVFKNAMEKTLESIEAKSTSKPFYYKIDFQNKPGSLTGYRTPNVDKVKALLTKFIASCNPVLNDRLKLNKLLFYADFQHYKQYGYSITGLSYRAIQFGPVPSCYENIFVLLESESLIFADWQMTNSSGAREVFFVQQLPQLEILSESEVKVADVICDRFTETPSWDLVELSHKERAWKDLHKTKALIDYQVYAFQMVEI